MGILTGDRQKESLEALAAAEIIAELKNLGNVITRLRTAVQNNILAVEMTTFPADGVIHRTYPQNFRSIAISNHDGANQMTLANGPPGNFPVAGGIGVYRVLAGKSAVVNMQGASFTIYGTPGNEVSFQVFDKTQPPSFA